jgi:hypothetical protein
MTALCRREPITITRQAANQLCILNVTSVLITVHTSEPP